VDLLEVAHKFYWESRVSTIEVVAAEYVLAKSFIMNHLRVLVIERDPEKLERISTVLTEAQYEVLPAPSFGEATEALQVQRFDAVLVGSPGKPHEQADFTAGLRRIERSNGLLSKTPVLLCSGAVPHGLWTPTQEDWVDAYLPEEFVAATFTDAVVRLAQALTPALKPKEQASSSDLPIFEPDKFQAQVAYDRELLVEIIDLFLVERRSQVAEMQAALSAADFVRLSRVAHTIKGSLGSLHASLARWHSQELESAARAADVQVCRFCLAVLEQDLDNLEPELIALRTSSL
jgi:HPt (histidine-containing phosphotransfer) domain-containing protein/CheY-like chemotaxis protein